MRAAPDVVFVLTADACYSRAHLDREVIPRAVWNVETMLDSYSGFRALEERWGCHLIFGHDPDQWARMRHVPEAMTT